MLGGSIKLRTGAEGCGFGGEGGKEVDRFTGEGSIGITGKRGLTALDGGGDDHLSSYGISGEGISTRARLEDSCFILNILDIEGVLMFIGGLT